MGILDTARRLLSGYREARTGTISGQRDEALQIAEEFQQKAESLKEGLVELELAADELGWIETGNLGKNAWNFKRVTLKKILDLSRSMYLANPLYRRSIEVQALYVWALGVTIKSKDKAVQEVLDDFFDSPRNKSVLTDGEQWANRERQQQITGNSFLVFFVNRDTGAARVRTLPVDEIEEIISNPDDSKEVWFYKRVYQIEGKEVIVLYPDIDLDIQDNPGILRVTGGKPVQWDAPVLHVKTGGLEEMMFGLPEYYSITSWAVAYKDFLANWATIMKAYSRMAMKISGLQGKAGVAAAKSKIGTTVTSGSMIDKNPPNNTASWFMASGGVDISAVKTAGATTGADEGKPIKDMVASGAGLPSHFYGDADMGNFATSTTLDRPTELKFVSRQKLWMGVIEHIIERLMVWSVQAPEGVLRKAGFVIVEREDPFDATISSSVVLTLEQAVEIAFPSILERNVTERVRAVVAAATLNGSKAEGIIPDRKYLAGLILQALDVQDWQGQLDLLYPKEVLQGFIDPVDELKVAQDKAKAAQDQVDVAADAAKAVAKNGTGSPPVSNRK